MCVLSIVSQCLDRAAFRASSIIRVAIDDTNSRSWHTKISVPEKFSSARFNDSPWACPLLDFGGAREPLTVSYETNAWIEAGCRGTVTVGFWDGDRLVTHTVDLLPVDYFRGEPLTSHRFESVEIWELKTLDDGTRRLEVQATFYDEHALVAPIDAVYAFVPAAPPASAIRSCRDGRDSRQ
jgi:hypothetical protein